MLLKACNLDAVMMLVKQVIKLNSLSINLIKIKNIYQDNFSYNIHTTIFHKKKKKIPVPFSVCPGLQGVLCISFYLHTTIKRLKGDFLK